MESKEIYLYIPISLCFKQEETISKDYEMVSFSQKILSFYYIIFIV